PPDPPWSPPPTPAARCSYASIWTAGTGWPIPSRSTSRPWRRTLSNPLSSTVDNPGLGASVCAVCNPGLGAVGSELDHGGDGPHQVHDRNVAVGGHRRPEPSRAGEPGEVTRDQRHRRRPADPDHPDDLDRDPERFGQIGGEVLEIADSQDQETPHKEGRHEPGDEDVGLAAVQAAPAPPQRT